MERIPLSINQNQNELERLAVILKQSKFFQKIGIGMLIEMMRQGEIVRFKTEEVLIKEKVSRKPEIFVLIEGVLAVTSNQTFLMRMDKPGDVAGEMSVISQEDRHTASVIAETDGVVIAFPQTLFQVDESATSVPVAYLIFTHILSEKLRITSAQVMMEGKLRESDDVHPLVGVMETDKQEQEQIITIIERLWDKKELKIIENISSLGSSESDSMYDLLILDPLSIGDNGSRENIRDIISICASRTHEMIVISTFAEDPENRKSLAKWGVSEFLSKTYSDFDLEHILNRQRVIFYSQRELKRVGHDADTDPLTGLANRRRLDEFLEALVTLHPGEKIPFSLIMTDVDNFKNYNDTHGHQMGDVVLSRIAGILKNRIRRGDLAARFGGEEFVVILPRCDKKNAFQIAEHLRKAVEDEDIPHQEQQPLENLTATFGVATFPDDAEDIETLLKKADECLYKGKESGRNVVVSVFD